MAKITVQNTDIAVVKYNDEDYISLTDMARSQMQEHIIFRWLSLKSTIEYLGEWEEYQRLKTEEQRLLSWSAKRELSKINYRIHTNAIKQNLIPAEVTPAQASIIYANEADILNTKKPVITVL